jgi:hypothetical protein
MKPALDWASDASMFVIHEGVGLVKGAATGRGWLFAGSLTAGRSGAELVQSSIRPRWAGQSVVRCSGAQSSGRPSLG